MNNIADSSGGAIYINEGTLNVTNTTFNTNEAKGNLNPNGGGAIFNKDGNVTVNNNSSFIRNTATGISGSGGAIFNAGGGIIPGSLVINNATFSQNTAKRAGGAIEDNVGAGTVLIDSTVMDSNMVMSNPGNGGAIHITGAGNFNITNSQFTNNIASAEGGALWNGAGTMSVDSSSFNNNTASGALANQGGGAIYSLRGPLNVSNSIIRGNSANGTAGSGGGILIDSAGALTLTNSILAANSSMRAGGGLEDNSGAASTILISNVNIDSNTTASAPGNGGGIHITGPGNIAIVGGTVNYNIASAEGGGLWNGSGLMTVSNVTINGNIASGSASTNGGGGIFNNGGELTVFSTTISNNITDGTAGSGGGIHNDQGIINLNNNTISGNTSINFGGGIYNRGKASIISNTIAFNQSNNGSGVAQELPIDTLIISSSIVANNISTGAVNEIFNGGNLTSNGYNLIGKTDASTFTAAASDTVGTLTGPIDPKIDTLANNGGPTLTHRLQCLSPAINAGDPSITDNDQRGLSIYLNRRDMGAFERQDSCLTSSVFSNQLNKLTGSKIYPNPVSQGNLTFDIPQEFGTKNTVLIIEVGTGRTLVNTEMNYGIHEINTTKLASGIYVVQIISGNSSETHRLIISK